jgi:xanthine dehydrogenase accessory factor
VSERIIGRLAARLAAGEAVVMASVVEARGATPRAVGARMLVGADDDEGTIGGGVLEARTIEQARALLATGGERDELAIELTGGPGSAGVCGGRMRIALRRWHGTGDRSRAASLAAQLAAGEAAELSETEAGASDPATRIDPDPRLVIVGGGHCGLALYELARPLEYDLAVYDPRPEFANSDRFPGALALSGEPSVLMAALDTPRTLHVVLLTRDFPSDVAALAVIARAPRRPQYLGMMGSARRIHAVRQALPELVDALSGLVAPVGLDIGAETPHEIAISVLAQLVMVRRGLVANPDRARGRYDARRGAAPLP